MTVKILGLGKLIMKLFKEDENGYADNWIDILFGVASAAIFAVIFALAITGGL